MVGAGAGERYADGVDSGVNGNGNDGGGDDSPVGAVEKLQRLLKAAWDGADVQIGSSCPALSRAFIL
mgnify:CR=1 FL=1